MKLLNHVIAATVLILLPCNAQDVKQMVELYQNTPVDHYTIEVQPQEASAEEEDAYLEGLVQLAEAGQTGQPLLPVTMIDAMDAAEESQEKQLSNLVRHAETEGMRLAKARPHYGSV